MIMNMKIMIINMIITIMIINIITTAKRLKDHSAVLQDAQSGGKLAAELRKLMKPRAPSLAQERDYHTLDPALAFGKTENPENQKFSFSNLMIFFTYSIDLCFYYD